MRRFGMARGLCLVLLVVFVFLTIACEGSDFKKATCSCNCTASDTLKAVFTTFHHMFSFPALNHFLSLQYNQGGR